jgi:hypothetical protein
MILALKLFLTPLLIALATLVGRKWGPAVSGWLIGLPLTSGPVSLILALQYGTDYAVHAAAGTLAGQVSVCLFCLAYSLAAARMKWYASAGLAILAFFGATLFWNQLSLPLIVTFFVALLLINLIFRLIPARKAAIPALPAPKWDLPARMLLATTFVVLITGFSPLLGPQLSGLLSPFPVFGLVLAIFAHRQQGADAATHLLRGVVLGSFGFISFFLIVGLALPVLGIPWTYLLASLAAILLNGILLKLIL